MEPTPLPPTPPLLIDRSINPIGFPDPALEEVLRAQLFPPGTNPESCRHEGGLRYVYNRVDLDGDRKPETLVALFGRQGCGKEGCPVMLFREVGRRMAPMQTLLGFHSALIVAERTTKGWRDLILAPSPEPRGMSPILFSHDGKGYPIKPPVTREGSIPTPSRGMAALVVKGSPFLVQGHPLPCPSERGQRKSVFNKVPMALPRSSLLLEEPLRPPI